MDDRSTQMAEIAQAILNLQESPLYEFRKEHGYQPVIGEGSLQANIMFIGEAPGEREAKTGRPFVGASGRMLDELFEMIGLSREDVYITNVVKDRPPENRDPTVEEIRLYAPFLLRQIQLIQPQVIATLGRFAMEFILKTFSVETDGQKISQLHGKLLEAQTPFGKIIVLPLYHPAVALYNQDQRETLQQDILVLRQFVQAGRQQ